MVNESTETVSPTESRTGRVKWFNNRAGYGFVTDSEGDIDYFVHHSAIKVGKEQYKYLVQGEYVNFSLVKSESESYEFQVGEVSGVNGGQLMCETREEVRSQRRERSGAASTTEGGEGEGEQQQNRAPRRRARRGGSGPRDGPRDGAREGEEWMLVRRAPRRPQQRGGRGGRGGGGGRQPRAPRDETSQQS